MTTITRQQLRDAIEAGITAVGSHGGRVLSPAESAALRAVGNRADVVARGTYMVVTNAPDPCVVRCPMAQAFPGAWGVSWAGTFTWSFDRATRLAVGDDEWDDTILHIEDDNTTEGEA